MGGSLKLLHARMRLALAIYIRVSIIYHDLVQNSHKIRMSGHFSVFIFNVEFLKSFIAQATPDEKVDHTVTRF